MRDCNESQPTWKWLFDVAVLAGVGVLLYHVWWYSSL